MQNKSKWFGNHCCQAKSEFLQAQRIFCDDPSVLNQTNFLTARSNFVKAKRKAKMKYYGNEESKLSALGKTSPCKFWKYMKKSLIVIKSLQKKVLMMLTSLKIFNVILIYNMGSLILVILRIWTGICLFKLKSLINLLQ